MSSNVLQFAKPTISRKHAMACPTTERQPIFVCSRFRFVSPVQNVWYYNVAIAMTRFAVELGWAPYTPHLYLPLALDDNDPKARAQGLEIGWLFQRQCKAIMVYLGDGVSDGMRLELENARKWHQQVFEIFEPGEIGLCPTLQR